MDDNQREDQLMAALCHFSILIPIMGCAIPLGIWMSQKDRSLRLKFHAMQALVYQVAAILLYFVLMGCQMVGSFAFFPVMILPATLMDRPSTEITDGAGILFFALIAVLMLLSILVNVVLCVGAPIYIVLALVGGWRVLNEKNFSYPLIGKWVEKSLGIPNGLSKSH